MRCRLFFFEFIQKHFCSVWSTGLVILTGVATHQALPTWTVYLFFLLGFPLLFWFMFVLFLFCSGLFCFVLFVAGVVCDIYPDAKLCAKERMFVFFCLDCFPLLCFFFIYLFFSVLFCSCSVPVLFLFCFCSCSVLVCFVLFFCCCRFSVRHIFRRKLRAKERFINNRNPRKLMLRLQRKRGFVCFCCCCCCCCQ